MAVGVSGMDITREDATRHFLPVRAPPMVSPPVKKKNTELTIPTDSPNIQLSNTHPVVLAMRTMMPYIMLRMPIVAKALVAYFPLTLDLSLGIWTT